VIKAKNEEKLLKAKTNAVKSFEYIKHYESKGSKVVADEIADNVDLNMVTASRIEDKLKLFFEVERLKTVAEKDTTKKQAYHFAKAAIDSLKPLTKKHQDLGQEKNGSCHGCNRISATQ
jgi:hypothetical protein